MHYELLIVYNIRPDQFNFVIARILCGKNWTEQLKKAINWGVVIDHNLIKIDKCDYLGPWDQDRIQKPLYCILTPPNLIKFFSFCLPKSWSKRIRATTYLIGLALI